MHLQARETVPESTTNVILGCAIGFGVLALVVGSFLTYKAYMRRIEYHEDRDVPATSRTKRRRSSTSSRDRTSNRGRSRDGRRRSRETQRRHNETADSNVENGPTGIREAQPYFNQLHLRQPPRQNHTDGVRDMRSDAFEPGPSVSRQKRTVYPARHADRNPASVSDPAYHDRRSRPSASVYRGNREYVGRSRSYARTNYAPTPWEPYPRGGAFSEHEMRRDTPNPNFHPNATNTTLRPRTATADEEMEGTIPEHVQSSVDRLREMFPPSAQARGATLTPPAVPMNAASDASQLISALDAESFHRSPRGESRVQSPAVHSQASDDLTHSITSSMSNNRGYGQESEHQQYSERDDSLADTESHGDYGGADAHDDRHEEGSAPSTMRPDEQVPTDTPGVPASNAQEHQPAHDEW